MSIPGLEVYPDSPRPAALVYYLPPLDNNEAPTESMRTNGWLIKRVSAEYVYIQVDQLLFDTQALYAFRRALLAVEAGHTEEAESES